MLCYQKADFLLHFKFIFNLLFQNLNKIGQFLLSYVRNAKLYVFNLMQILFSKLFQNTFLIKAYSWFISLILLLPALIFNFAIKFILLMLVRTMILFLLLYFWRLLILMLILTMIITFVFKLSSLFDTQVGVISQRWKRTFLALIVK